MGFKVNKTSISTINENGILTPIGLVASSKQELHEWLDKHPEATSSVQDGSIGKEKLSSTLLNELDNTKESIKKNTDDISDLRDTKADRTELTNPYKFRGTLDDISDLPAASTENWNDAYYIKNEKCQYTSNGKAWFQSSLGESGYTDLIENAVGNIVTEKGKEDEFTQIIYNTDPEDNVEVPTMEEFNALLNEVNEIKKILYGRGDNMIVTASFE